MSPHHEIISADDVGTAFCEALGLEPDRVQRIIIDLDMTKFFPLVYVQMMGDKRLLSVNWAAGFEGADVTVLGNGE